MDEGDVPERDKQPDQPDQPDQLPDRLPDQQSDDAEQTAPGAGDEACKTVGDPAVEPFSRLQAGITALRQLPAYTRSNAEARAFLTRAVAMRATLDVLVLELVADLDRRFDAIPGCRPDFVARTFLRRRLHRTSSQARHEVECARRLTGDTDPLTGGLPLFGRALAAGQVSREHADVAVRAVAQLSAEELGRPRARSLFDGLLRPDEGPDDAADDGAADETAGEASVPTGYALDAVLTAQARLLDSHQLYILARRIVAAIKDDDRDGFDPDAVDRRYVTHAQDPETGMIIGKFQLDAENGAWFETAMEQFARRDEPRDETTQDGEGSTTSPVRTPGQVAADALGEICRIALASEQAGTATGAERPRIVVTTGLDTLRQTLLAGHHESDAAGDTAVHWPAPGGVHPDKRPAQAEHTGQVGHRLLSTLACDSILQRAVFAPSGAVLDLGREVRTVTKAQRRALNARDRGCVLPGCTAPPRRCQAHHVTWWRHAGASDIDNLALVCSPCHTRIHLGTGTGGWELVMIHGVPWARPPRYLDPDRRLVRNTFHDTRDQAAASFGTQLGFTLDGGGGHDEAENEPDRPGNDRPSGESS